MRKTRTAKHYYPASKCYLLEPFNSLRDNGLRTRAKLKKVSRLNNTVAIGPFAAIDAFTGNLFDAMPQRRAPYWKGSLRQNGVDLCGQFVHRVPYPANDARSVNDERCGDTGHAVRGNGGRLGADGIRN